MGIIEIIFLSFIQGVSEFLPISSSGHLIIFHEFFNKDLEGSLEFDVALHLGTILSIMLYFHKDFMNLLKDSFAFILFRNNNPRLLWQMVIATIPAVIFGVIIMTLNLESYFRIIPIIACNLIIFGIILYFADKKGLQKTDLYEISKKQSFFIGLAQMIALIPGVSRSGICLSMSRFLGVEKASAVKFSMLISIPAILGAALLSLLSIREQESFLVSDFIIGITLSFIFGLIFIKFLMEFIKRFDFKVFMIYRIALGIILLLTYYLL